MLRYVVDIESDGLLDTITKIHCLCWKNIDTNERGSIIGYELMILFLQQDNLTIIGHNFIRFDAVALKMILQISLHHIRLIDTLGISWYLYPDRIRHGLDEWGEDLGIQKPPIDNWKGITIEEQQILDYYEQLSK